MLKQNYVNSPGTICKLPVHILPTKLSLLQICQRGVVACQRGVMAQWYITSNSVLRMNPTKGSHCFLEQETLPSLLSTGWFQEWFQA